MERVRHQLQRATAAPCLFLSYTIIYLERANRTDPKVRFSRPHMAPHPCGDPQCHLDAAHTARAPHARAGKPRGPTGNERTRPGNGCDCGQRAGGCGAPRGRGSPCPAEQRADHPNAAAAAAPGAALRRAPCHTAMSIASALTEASGCFPSANARHKANPSSSSPRSPRSRSGQGSAGRPSKLLRRSSRQPQHSCRLQRAIKSPGKQLIYET